MTSPAPILPEKVYQIKIHLVGISPMVWRRLLVPENTSLSKLHGTIQIVMGWENAHLHSFKIYGKGYGINYAGGMMFSDDPRKVSIKDFQFRKRDKFFYHYNFYHDWKHELRIEDIVQTNPTQSYPCCKAGKNACPPEETPGLKGFHQLRELFRIPVYDLLRIIKFQENLGYPWRPDNFKRRTINSMLRNTDYDYMSQSDPIFPDHDSPYFEDKYWYKKDNLQALKNMYQVLKQQGIEIEEEPDCFIREATGLKVMKRMMEELLK